jgi:predicted glycoside hydrolase/deacetylase ChbG (UPF0249 family)
MRPSNTENGKMTRSTDAKRTVRQPGGVNTSGGEADATTASSTTGPSTTGPSTTGPHTTASSTAVLPPTRRLIVNADDFGRTEAVNKGVILAYEEGIVTSASLMVRWPTSGDAAAYADAHQELSLGIHIDLGEWRPVDGKWETIYEIAPITDAGAVTAEVANQLGRFNKLMGRPPTHIDSHQHVHRTEPVRSVIAEFARKLSIPVRHQTPGVRYCGDFYGQASDGSSMAEGITVDSLVSIFDGLEPGVTELSCHPGLDDDLDEEYSWQRGVELRSLCDPEARQALVARDISLISYRALPQP